MLTFGEDRDVINSVTNRGPGCGHEADRVAAVTVVAGALQKQVIEDFQPIWNRTATFVAVQSINQIPHYAWPVIIVDKPLGDDALGYHLDQNNRPYALVEATASWTLTASHEILEMLADPSGNRKQVASTLDSSKFPGDVQYLLEICDPCEAPQFSYTKNGIPVSDFITPDFYNSVARPNASYSFRGNIKQPMDILEGGYVSFFDPHQESWFQAFRKNNVLDFKILPQEDAIRSMRSYVNRHAPHQPPALSKDDPIIRHAQNVLHEHQEANSKRAELFLKHLRSVHPRLTADLIGTGIGTINIGAINIF